MIKNGDKIYNASKHHVKDYHYEKHNEKVTGEQDTKSKPKEMTEEDRQKVVTRMLAGASKPNGANRPYGTGEEIASAGVAVARVGEVKIEGSKGYFAGETVFLEARARTYTRTKTTVGAEAQASLMRSEYGGKVSESLWKVGDAEIIGVGAYGKGEFFVGGQGNVQAGYGFKGPLPYAAASAHVFAGARVNVGVGGEARLLGLGVRLDGRGYAWAGAQGSAEASASPAGIKLGVEGFAGASAGVSGTASIGGIGVTGTADAYAGAGGKAGVGIGMTDEGDIVVSAELGGALGVGAGTGVEVSIDTDQVISDAGAVWKNLNALAAEMGNGAAQGASGLANVSTSFLADLGKAASETANDAAETAGNVAQDVVNTAQNVAEDAGEAAGDVAETATNTVSSGANAVADFFGF